MGVSSGKAHVSVRGVIASKAKQSIFQATPMCRKALSLKQPMSRSDKSFLVLFFKKELLPFLTYINESFRIPSGLQLRQPCLGGFGRGDASRLPYMGDAGMCVAENEFCLVILPPQLRAQVCA
jgi:hypothetical protein